MSQRDYAITFACLNQIEYTKQCVNSLIATGIDLSRVCVVDNGSTDGTREYLQSIPFGAVILNKQNLGCGVAWNQGALALQAEWTVVMNNDVICPAGWLEGLIAAAERHNLQVASPSLMEGVFDYDLAAFSADAMNKLHDVVRAGEAHGVCMLVHESVWQKAGYFYSVPRLLGHEDTLFFNDVREAGLRMGTVGAAWLHHYGSVTQKAMKFERMSNRDLGDHALMKKMLGQNFLVRKFRKFQRKRASRQMAASELAQFGMTLRGERLPGETRWH